MDEPSVTTGVDGKPRCFWCAGHDDLISYHDAEWGFPVTDDRRLFEKLCLEGFQSGLSWLTILRKRGAFRRAFAGFDFDKVARFGPRRPTHAGRRVDRPPPGKDRIGDRGMPDARGCWPTSSARSPPTPGDMSPTPRDDRREASTSPEAVALSKDLQEAWMDLRRPDHHLCVHAGDGARQRSRARLRDASRCGESEADAARPLSDVASGLDFVTDTASATHTSQNKQVIVAVSLSVAH